MLDYYHIPNNSHPFTRVLLGTYCFEPCSHHPPTHGLSHAETLSTVNLANPSSAPKTLSTTSYTFYRSIRGRLAGDRAPDSVDRQDRVISTTSEAAAAISSGDEHRSQRAPTRLWFSHPQNRSHSTASKYLQDRILEMAGLINAEPMTSIA